MFVVLVDRDSEPALLIYNAVKLTTRLERQLQNLHYPIKYLVVPNREHTLFCADYLEKFPSIECICLKEVRGKIESKVEDPKQHKFLELDPNGGKITPEIEYKTIAGLHYGSEIVLYHSSSSVLLTCDTAMKYTPNMIPLKDPLVQPVMQHWAKLFGFENKIVISSSFRYILKDKRRAAESIERVCKDWQIHGIGMAHGVPQEPKVGDMEVVEQWRKSWMEICK